MKRDERRQLSKTMAHALRHAPWLYELEMDGEGWVPVEQLISGLRRHRRKWQDLTVEDLQAVIDAPGKKRYEIDGERIRAYYGHSLEGKISKEPARPPEKLYHGTANDVVGAILTDGLQSMSRQYVHLSTDLETAQQVGQRKSNAVTILVVEAARAYEDGIGFYHGNQMVWLADAIPGGYISVM